MKVCFKWMWRDELGAPAYELTEAHLHHLLSGREVPVPASLHLRDRTFQARLEAYAQEQTLRTLCAIAYRGKPVGNGFQPDPAKWDLAVSETKSNTAVCFEYLHIRAGPQKKRLLVYVNVNHVLHQGRMLPKNPMTSRNAGNYFSVDWMNAFAELKRKGAAY